MKKRLRFLAMVTLIGVFALAPAAMANQSNVGCGLGTMMFAGNMDSTLFQVFAATTNGSSGNQTFGISSGTLECAKPASFVKNERLEEFVASNMDSIATDMAAGSGESLDTLAELMGVSADQKPGFFAKLQQNFGTIFSSSDVQSAEVIDNIVKVTS